MLTKLFDYMPGLDCDEITFCEKNDFCLFYYIYPQEPQMQHILTVCDQMNA